MNKRGRTSISDFVDFDSDSSSGSPSQSPLDSEDERGFRKGDGIGGSGGYDSDEDLEVMIESRRKRRKHFDDDDGERYKRPIAFVKKGLAADEVLKHEYDDDDNNNDNENDNNNNNNNDNDNDSEYGIQQNFSFGRGGLGFNSNSRNKATMKGGNDTRKNYSNFLDMNNNSGKDAFDSVYGKGSKILKSMGWSTGEGLGKEKDGIAEPIQVKLRPKGRGLGCGVDEMTEQQKRMERMDQQQQQQQQQQPRQKRTSLSLPTGMSSGPGPNNRATGYAALPDEEKLWKRGRDEKTVRRNMNKPKYVVVDDDDDDGSGGGYYNHRHHHHYDHHDGSIDAAVDRPREIITDMRGPHARIVGSVAEALRTNFEEEEGEDEEGEGGGGGGSGSIGNPLLPLQHNVQLLADMARDKMQANSRRAKEAGTTLSALEISVGRESRTLEATRKVVQRLGELRAAIAGVARPQLGSTDTRGLCASLRALRTRFPEEWSRFNFDGFALGLCKPVFTYKLELWNPIADPTDYLDDFDEWKKLFNPVISNKSNEDDNNNKDYDDDAFSNMLTEVFLPRVREAALKWNVRDCDPMINFLVLWTPVLTQAIRDYITANVVFPRLQAEVEAWNPRTDPTAVHLWLHPWLPVLGPAVLEPLWAPVRQKMGSALVAWQPADPSAHAILAPWAPVFGEAAMGALLSRCIVPKLGAELRRHGVVAGPLGADPQQLPRPELVARLGAKPLVWAVSWADLLGADAAAQLLEADFLPAWARALLTWVGGNGGKVDTEVGWWYQGWKLLFPEALIKHVTVQRYFKYALSLMSCALAGKPFPPLPVANSSSKSSQQHIKEERGVGGGEEGDGDGVGLTLKEVLEQLAARANILFTPTSKTYGGKDVYKFGATSVVVDSRLIYAHNPGTGKWDTVTLDELVRKNSAAAAAPEPSSNYDDVE